MTSRYVPFGWYQLKHQKFRLLAAVAGIALAVILMLIQQGFQEALFVSSVRWHEKMQYDLAMLSPRTNFFLHSVNLPRNRLYQAQGVPGIKSVSPMYTAQASWRNPTDRSNTRTLFVVGFDPTDQGFSNLLSPDQLEEIKKLDRILFDEKSRPEFGPIPELLASGEPLSVDLNGRELQVVGLFSVGTSFGIDGAVATSDLNFRRIFPNHPASHISLGLLQLEEGADLELVKQRVIDTLPKDIRVVTAREFRELEINYWNGSTPIGYIFSFGVIMGFVVGVIIVYQILYADVQDHLKEYATLKAMGYTNGFLSRVVIQESIILAILGFFPGVLLTIQLYKEASIATNLPLEMTLDRGLAVFGLTLLMCVGSGLIAIRKLKSADPAEVF